MSNLSQICLTKRIIDSIEADVSRQMIIRDGRLEGLRLRVRPSGRKTFEYRDRFEARDKLFVVGDYGNITC